MNQCLLKRLSYSLLDTSQKAPQICAGLCFHYISNCDFRSALLSTPDCWSIPQNYKLIQDHQKEHKTLVKTLITGQHHTFSDKHLGQYNLELSEVFKYEVSDQKDDPKLSQILVPQLDKLLTSEGLYLFDYSYATGLWTTRKRHMFVVDICKNKPLIVNPAILTPPISEFNTRKDLHHALLTLLSPSIHSLSEGHMLKANEKIYALRIFKASPRQATPSTNRSTDNANRRKRKRQR
ncbi:MAG: hypothetical protein CL521_00960 [Actinobacteria bacterium]|nr:hypothetical protein [Actinomycetota bacterium]